MKDLTSEFELGGQIYLDSAATTLKPRKVVDRLSHFYLHESAPVHRSVYHRAQLAEHLFYSARKKVQTFLHANSCEEIIFTHNTTHSLNLLARSLPTAFLRPGDGVVVSEIEHHSNLVPWQIVAKENGLKLYFVKVDDHGIIDLNHLEELLQEKKVKLVSILHVSHVTGSIQPIEEISHLAHRYGAFLSVDGAQAVAHQVVDVQKLDVDFYAFSAHKMYGPFGVGVLYGKKELLQKMAPFFGGGGMVDRVTQEESTWIDSSMKFEAGTPAIAEIVAFQTAIEWLQEIDLHEIALYENKLQSYAFSKLSRFSSLEWIGKSNSSLLSFRPENMHPLDLAILLSCRNICVRSGHLCSQIAMQRFGKSEVVRISFGVYNTFRDIDILSEAMEAIFQEVKEVAFC